MDIVSALQPDAFVILSDDVPCDSKHQRAATSVTRTLAWLDQCFNELQTRPKLPNAAVFATIQGGQYLDEREKCVKGIVAHANSPKLTGYVVGGLATAESREVRSQIIEAVIKELPEAAVKVVTGVGNPEEVLESIEQGIDIFDTAYPTELANGGYALCFPVDFLNNSANNSDSEGNKADTSERDDTKMNLWAAAFKTDTRPFVQGCDCPACTRHTRAYVHHLLNAHEMTAQVLLEAHNTRHYARFFEAVRTAIAQGKFKEYRSAFMDRKAEWMSGI